MKQSQKYFIDVDKDQQTSELKNASANVINQAKEQAKKNIEEIIKNNNLTPTTSEKEPDFVVKSSKSLNKKLVGNIEPQLIVKDSKRNNFKRYRSASQ